MKYVCASCGEEMEVSLESDEGKIVLMHECNDALDAGIDEGLRLAKENKWELGAQDR
jgi:hypothetical protein